MTKLFPVTAEGKHVKALLGSIVAEHPRKLRKKARTKSFYKHWLMDQFSGRCPYCAVPMRTHRHSQDKVGGSVATFDHVVPKSKNGPNSFDNLLIVCSHCNRDRGNMSLIAFLKTPALLRRRRNNLNTYR